MRPRPLSVSLLLVLLLLVCLLPSCAEFPLTARIVGQGGTLTYNRAHGLGIEIDASGSK